MLSTRRLMRIAKDDYHLMFNVIYTLIIWACIAAIWWHIHKWVDAGSPVAISVNGQIEHVLLNPKGD